MDPQPPDADRLDALPPSEQPSPPSTVSAGGENIPATLSNDGRFIQYNIFGHIFEVTAKYKPPIILIGRGAYGIVIFSKAFYGAPHGRGRSSFRDFRTLGPTFEVVAIRDIIPLPRRESFNDVYIAYELMGADLHQIICLNPDLPHGHCQYFLYQILRGLKYIHSANVLHRDLKPSNLLLNTNCDLKICDFGLARIISETAFMTEDVVTRWYRAPELVLCSSEYTAAIDVWSVGCIFMELMDRKPLFPGKNLMNQLQLLLEFFGTPTEADLGGMSEGARRLIRCLPHYPPQSFAAKFPTVPALAIDLAKKMLTFDPRRRISVEDALAHPYLAPLSDLKEEPVCMNPFPFSFDFEQHVLTEEQIKELIYQEALACNPGYQ